MKKVTSVEQALITGLQDIKEYESGRKKLKTKQRELPEAAPEFKSKEIQLIRKKILQMTQEEFARVLNVAVATLRSWEQGVRRPEKAANRLLQIIKERPEVVLMI